MIRNCIDFDDALSDLHENFRIIQKMVFAFFETTRVQKYNTIVFLLFIISTSTGIIMLSAGIGVPPPLPAAGAREARAKELCHDREPASDARVSHEDGTNLEIDKSFRGAHEVGISDKYHFVPT